MNKFNTLTMIQKNTKEIRKGFWVVRFNGKVVSNIVKTTGNAYGVTINMTEHKSFMAALASLLGLFAETVAEYRHPAKTVSHEHVIVSLFGYSDTRKDCEGYHVKTALGKTILLETDNTTVNGLMGKLANMRGCDLSDIYSGLVSLQRL